MIITYRLVEPTTEHAAGIQCLKCMRTSFHPRDVSELFCGRCHEFHRAPLSRVALDIAPCSECGSQFCKTHGVDIRAKCHPKAGVQATYFANPGALEFTCGECGRPIVAIAVADKAG